MSAKNIIFYFSDQQRWDTINATVTPHLHRLADEGVTFANHYTCQPVCGPARACLQSGQYATGIGCWRNGIPLPLQTKTLAHYFNDAGYQTAYIGKWHLASDLLPHTGFHCETTAVPKERQGGYRYWRAADVLEFTSHGYDGYVFDENGNKLEFKGYRADCINDYALEFIENRKKDQPFFLFISQLEPHHQNDRHHYEGFRDTLAQYQNYPIPDDLSFLPGNYRQEYPDYISAVNRLDHNVGRLIDKLKAEGIYEDTVLIYTSDHGSHFKTRNAEYKRSCHESCCHTPLIIKGGGFDGGRTEERLTSLIDIPPTLLSLAGIAIPDAYDGIDLTDPDFDRDCVFMQISEASNSRAIRTKRYKYEVRDPSPLGITRGEARVYAESYLYDLQKDPNEKHNLIRDPQYRRARRECRQLLLKQMKEAGETAPLILPALKTRRK